MIKTWLTALGTWPTHQTVPTSLWISWWGILCKSLAYIQFQQASCQQEIAFAQLLPRTDSHWLASQHPRDQSSFLRGLVVAGFHLLTLGLEGYVDPKFWAEPPLLQVQHFLLLSFHLGRWRDGPCHPHLQREVVGLHVLQGSAGGVHSLHPASPWMGDFIFREGWPFPTHVWSKSRTHL